VSTPTQRLEKARRVRRRTSAELVALSSGRVSLRDVLEDPRKTPLRRARIYDVLRRAPHISDAGAKKILLGSQIWPLTKLGDLSKYDRDSILKYLPPRAK
jgi:hypothetical protein